MVYRKTERVLDKLAQRRVDIITGAIAMANDAGLDKLNVNHLCRYNGIATGTIYLHFPNRDDLLAAVVARCAEEDTRAMQADADRETNPMLRLTRALQRFMQLYNASKHLHPSLLAREGYRHAIVRTLAPMVAATVIGRAEHADMIAVAIVGALHMVLLTQGRPTQARLTALLEAVLRMAHVTPQTYRAMEAA